MKVKEVIDFITNLWSAGLAIIYFPIYVLAHGVYYILRILLALDYLLMLDFPTARDIFKLTFEKPKKL